MFSWSMTATRTKMMDGEVIGRPCPTGITLSNGKTGSKRKAVSNRKTLSNRKPYQITTSCLNENLSNRKSLSSRTALSKQEPYLNPKLHLA